MEKLKRIRLTDNGSEIVPYNNPAFPLYANTNAHTQFAGMAVGHHWHWDFEWNVVTQGQIEMEINGENVTIREGEGIFINSGRIHSSHCGQDSPQLWYGILFHPSVLRTAGAQTEDMLRRITDIAAEDYVLLKKDVPWQEEMLRQVVSFHRQVLDGIEENMMGIMGSAFLLAQNLYSHLTEGNDNPMKRKDLALVRSIVGYIQMHYAEKITLQDLCDAANLSGSTCNTLFQTYFRVSPMKYCNRYRLEKAAQLLQNADISMTEISARTGFQGSSYFAESFKAEYGCTPTEYRKLFAKV